MDEQADMTRRDSRWTSWYRGLGHRGRIALGTGTVAIAAAIALAVARIAAGAGTAPKALPLARNFSVPVLGHPGSRVSLSSLAGKPVIVNFFASWCAPCQRETPLLARYYRSGRHIEVIGIDTNDTARAAQKFVRRMGVSYPVGSDSPPNTAISYGVSALPQTFFLDARHRIVKRVFGAVTASELTAMTTRLSKQAE
jgi:cytochrome c biogenesis protein CcmG/thiol:disulfide interchange protein DsbE